MLIMENAFVATWQNTTIAIATAVSAAAASALLAGVFAAFLQLRFLRRDQKLSLLQSWLGEYRSRDMMRHVMAYIDWARDNGEQAPFVYCALHSVRPPSFEELHNHRRQMSQMLAEVAAAVHLGLYEEDFVVNLGGSAIDDAKFLLGVEWRLRKQIDQWDNIYTADTFQRWGLFELFIAYSAHREPERYTRFRRKRWLTPLAWWQRRAERHFSCRDILPRYRAFLNELRNEPGYDVWATAGLRAVDEDLRPEEAKRSDKLPSELSTAGRRRWRRQARRPGRPGRG